jgi:hypothetical protein
MTATMANGRLSAYNTTAGWVDICPAGSLGAAGTWSHVAYAYNGTTMYGYVNGQLCGSAAFVYTDNAAHTVYVGSWYSIATTYDFNGIIDEATIINSRRSADEIRQPTNQAFAPTIPIDFGASLNSGNLITSTSDLSFTMDATAYGFASMGNNLYRRRQITSGKREWYRYIAREPLRQLRRVQVQSPLLHGIQVPAPRGLHRERRCF